MQLINVVKGFVLTAEDGIKHEVAAGVQEVEDFIADHWYAKAHTAPVPETITKAANADKGKKAAAADAPPDTKAANADKQADDATQ